MHEQDSFTGSGDTGFWVNVKNGFENGLSGFASVTGFMITIMIALIPVVLIILLVVMLVKKYWRKMNYPAASSGVSQ